MRIVIWTNETLKHTAAFYFSEKNKDEQKKSSNYLKFYSFLKKKNIIQFNMIAHFWGCYRWKDK